MSSADLQRMNSNVGAIIEQRVFEFLGEEAFALKGCEGVFLVEIACGFDAYEFGINASFDLS